MAWFRVHVLMQAGSSADGAKPVQARELEYAVAAMDAMEAEDKAETLAARENTAWRCLGSARTVKFSNSAQPLNDVEDGEQLSAQRLEFADEGALRRYLVGQARPTRILPDTRP